MDIPKSLYKYQSFSELNIRALKQQSIYFGSSVNFNDPYDCSLTPRVAPQSSEQLEEFRVSQLSRNDLPEQARKELEVISTEKISQILIDNVEKVFSSHVKTFQKKHGISCFSKTNDNLLMWSHYGGHGSGFCLEFSTSFPPFNKPLKVNYSENVPEINPLIILQNDDFSSVLNIYTTKSMDWKYEQEWRIFHKDVGTNYTYTAESLTGIYFGSEMEQASIEIICLIIQGQNPNVKFYRGTRSSEKYRIDFEEFTYTNYSTAKNAGLVS